MKFNTDYTVHKRSKFQGFVDYISFNREVRHLVEILNTEIAAPETVVFRPISHPAGFVRLITKRRLTIAEAYIRLIAHSRNPHYTERIEALQVLMHHVWHSKSLAMPINTARVQIALIKQAVRMRGRQREQLELMSDFSRASYGKSSVIRRLLDELGLIEVPETGEKLSEMNLGWDDHVHDSMTEGRKSPSQLVLDAFIKGISRITVAYYDAASPETYEEIYLAGQILGIDVQIGIEFSVGEKFDRRHYMYIPPQGDEYEDLAGFFKENEDRLAPFWDGLRENGARRHETVNELLDGFNHDGRDQFNAPFSGRPLLQMPPLSWDDIDSVTSRGQMTRIHLGQLIYQSMRPIALKRVLYLKNQYREMEQSRSHDIAVTWELERSRRRYETACEEYEHLSPSSCSQQYVETQNNIDYDSAFAAEDDILPLLAECGGGIVFIHPLDRGVRHGIEFLFEHYHHITDIEVFNLVDVLMHDTVNIRQFASFLDAMKNSSAESVAAMLDEWQFQHPKIKKIAEMQSYMQAHPFKMRCASDAVGWSSNIPGMGFISAESLSPHSLRQFKKIGHSTLPRAVADLLYDEAGTAPEIYLMSSTLVQSRRPPVLPVKFSPARFWRYLNLNIRCLIYAILGFIPGFYFLGLDYAVIWFVITGFRNGIVDLIASSGMAFKSWNFDAIDRENLCASLFFSGVSVPILAGAAWGFDYIWTSFAFDEGFLYTFLKFWAIAFANGLYLVAHNTLRGFDKAAIRGNFFRSVLSWPLATIGSYGLTPLGVPDVVQSKIWSEVVAGFIEGTVKTLKQSRLTQKALVEVYHQLASSNAVNAKTARIDILFFWSKYGQGRRVLTRFMNAEKKKPRGLDDEDTQIVIEGNDILKNSFSTPGSLENLTDVILEYYPEENLPVLTDFIGEHHMPFVRWIVKV